MEHRKTLEKSHGGCCEVSQSISGGGLLTPIPSSRSWSSILPSFKALWAFSPCERLNGSMVAPLRRLRTGLSAQGGQHQRSWVLHTWKSSAHGGAPGSAHKWPVRGALFVTFKSQRGAPGTASGVGCQGSPKFCSLCVQQWRLTLKSLLLVVTEGGIGIWLRGP
jgi:hypothetical protein